MENLKLMELLEQFKAETKQPAIRLTTRRSDHITATNSKFGGLPYLPKNFAYPTDDKGNPLKLLAQLNFGELPPLADFPSEGILQFFVLHDGSIGLGGGLNTDYKVIYHEKIHENDQMTAFPEVKFVKSSPKETEWFPFEGEFLLTGELVNMRPDFGNSSILLEKVKPFFEKHGLMSYFESFPWTFEDSRKWERERKFMQNAEYKETVERQKQVQALLDGTFDLAFEPFHLVGGSPWFCQGDPRIDHFDMDDDLSKYGTLLFQMVSDDAENSEDVIMWGDDGVVNFFINRADLRNLKFDDVLYYGDCY